MSREAISLSPTFIYSCGKETTAAKSLSQRPSEQLKGIVSPAVTNFNKFEQKNDYVQYVAQIKRFRKCLIFQTFIGTLIPFHLVTLSL